jgi:hypothetical protein
MRPARATYRWARPRHAAPGPSQRGQSRRVCVRGGTERGACRQGARGGCGGLRQVWGRGWGARRVDTLTRGMVWYKLEMNGVCAAWRQGAGSARALPCRKVAGQGRGGGGRCIKRGSCRAAAGLTGRACGRGLARIFPKGLADASARPWNAGSVPGRGPRRPTRPRQRACSRGRPPQTDGWARGRTARGARDLRRISGLTAG